MKEIQGITPEIIAAIGASISIVLGDNCTKSKAMASGMDKSGLAVRVIRPQRAWIDAGRQNNMSNRLVR